MTRTIAVLIWCGALLGSSLALAGPKAAAPPFVIEDALLTSSGILLDGCAAEDEACQTKYLELFGDAVAKEEKKDFAGAVGAYEKAAPKAKKQGGVLYAMVVEYKLGVLQLAQGKPKLAVPHLVKVEKIFLETKSKAPAEVLPTMRAIAAEAAFHLAEDIARGIPKLPASSDQKVIKKMMMNKIKQMNNANDKYVKVISYQDPYWSVAAAARIGSMNVAFGDDMTSLPAPPGLSPEEQQAYQEALAGQAKKVYDKAHDIYGQCITNALEDKIVSPYVEEAVAGLEGIEAGDPYYESLTKLKALMAK